MVDFCGRCDLIESFSEIDMNDMIGITSFVGQINIYATKIFGHDEEQSQKDTIVKSSHYE